MNLDPELLRKILELALAGKFEEAYNEAGKNMEAYDLVQLLNYKFAGYYRVTPPSFVPAVLSHTDVEA